MDDCNVNLGGITLPDIETDQVSLQPISDGEDIGRLDLTLGNSVFSWDDEEIQMLLSMGSTGEATNVQAEGTPDAVGHLMSQNPVTFEGQAALELSTLANTMWFHGQFLPEDPGTGVPSFQATESFEQTSYSPMATPTGQTDRLTASEGYSDLIVPSMEDLIRTFNMTAPRDVPAQTQSVSASFENQSAALLPAPQSSFLDILSQSLSETLEPLDVLPTSRTQQIPIHDTSTRTVPTTLIQERIQERDNGPHYPAIRPAKRKNDEDLHSLNRSAKRLREPGDRKGPSGVPASCLTTFSVERVQEEPRKKTKNSCLNCIWNRKGCSETTPYVNCQCPGTTPGIPQTLCIRANITELNIFKRNNLYTVGGYENAPNSSLGSFRDVVQLWDNAYELMLITAAWSDNLDPSPEFFCQCRFNARYRRMIAFMFSFLHPDVVAEVDDSQEQYRRVSTAFAIQLFAGLQRNIRHLPQLGLEDFLHLLFELRCLEQLLEAKLGFCGLRSDDKMAKHLQDYLHDVVKILEERIKVDNPNVARYRLLRSIVTEFLDFEDERFLASWETTSSST